MITKLSLSLFWDLFDPLQPLRIRQWQRVEKEVETFAFFQGENRKNSLASDTLFGLDIEEEDDDD